MKAMKERKAKAREQREANMAEGVTKIHDNERRTNATRSTTNTANNKDKCRCSCNCQELCKSFVDKIADAFAESIAVSTTPVTSEVTALVSDGSHETRQCCKHAKDIGKQLVYGCGECGPPIYEILKKCFGKTDTTNSEATNSEATNSENGINTEESDEISDEIPVNRDMERREKNDTNISISIAPDSSSRTGDHESNAGNGIRQRRGNSTHETSMDLSNNNLSKRNRNNITIRSNNFNTTSSVNVTISEKRLIELLEEAQRTVGRERTEEMNKMLDGQNQNNNNTLYNNQDENAMNNSFGNGYDEDSMDDTHSNNNNNNNDDNNNNKEDENSMNISIGDDWNDDPMSVAMDVSFVNGLGGSPQSCDKTSTRLELISPIRFNTNQNRSLKYWYRLAGILTRRIHKLVKITSGMGMTKIQRCYVCAKIERRRVDAIKLKFPGVKLKDLRKLKIDGKKILQDKCGRTKFACTGCPVNSETISRFNLTGQRIRYLTFITLCEECSANRYDHKNMKEIV